MSKKEGITTITLDLPTELLSLLDSYCKKYYMSTRSTAIRVAIKKLVDEDNNNGQTPQSEE